MGRKKERKKKKKKKEGERKQLGLKKKKKKSTFGTNPPTCRKSCSVPLDEYPNKIMFNPALATNKLVRTCTCF